MMRSSYNIIISGGGTGGHIFPAISIANALKELLPNVKILFVGAEGRMEMDKVPAAGYEIKGLPIVGLNRKKPLSNISLPFKLISSLREATKIIKSFSPDIAIGVGGYASAPLLYKAKQMGIPYIIQEQNSYAGLTNRILGKRAKAICVAYHGMERFFKKEKIILTGNPIRDFIKRSTLLSKEEGLHHFGLDRDKKVILVTGGSLGALTLNESIKKFAVANQDSPVNIIWQTGRYYSSDIANFSEKTKRKYLKTVEFIDRMDLAFATADIVITRAGAGVISELCAAEKASILVPSPNVAEDHQTHNAISLVNNGAAIMVKDSEARDTLMDIAINLASDDSTIAELERNAAKMALPDSAKVIANIIIQYLS